MRDLTDVIVEFHSRAEIIPDRGGRSAVEQTIGDNNVNLVQSCPPLSLCQVEHVTTNSIARLDATHNLNIIIAEVRGAIDPVRAPRGTDVTRPQG
jgi:hypothetical protein